MMSYSNLNMKVAQQLAPEQQKALAVLNENLGRVDELFISEALVPSRFCETGFVAFSNRSMSKLPHGQAWIWNQSNGKVTVQLGNGNLVTLQKLNTRKKKNCPKPPSYKVWVCYIARNASETHSLTFLWCEKGAGASPLVDPSSSPSADSDGSESSTSIFDNSSTSSNPHRYAAPFFEYHPVPTQNVGVIVIKKLQPRSSAPILPAPLQIKYYSGPVAEKSDSSLQLTSQVLPPRSNGNGSSGELPSLSQLLSKRSAPDSGSLFNGPCFPKMQKVFTPPNNNESAFPSAANTTSHQTLPSFRSLFSC